MIYFLGIIFLLTNAITLAFIYFREQDVQKERQLLLDRIQARDIQEFKSYVEPVEDKPEEDKPEPIEFI